MEKIRKTFFVVITILLSGHMFFGQVPYSIAQTDTGWTEPVNLSLSGIATNPVLVVDSKNVLHALWVDDLDGYQYSQSPDGTTWTKPRIVNFPFYEEGALPVLLSGTNGLIHVFWIDPDANLFYAATSALNLANPATWQVSVRLARDVSDFQAIEDSRGALHVAYVDNVSTELSPAGIYYRQSLIGGGSWMKAINLYVSDYFRAAKPGEAFVGIAASFSESLQKVYVTWDSRPQKRVFMAASDDGGAAWAEAQQIKGPEDTNGVDLPFGLSVAAVDDHLLLIWQIGKPGTDQCSVFSQWSDDGGERWGEVKTVLDGRRDCPNRASFIIPDKNHIIAMLTGEGEPTLMAWNGSNWSERQVEVQLPTFASPVTFDAVLLGCRFDLIHAGRLYVVGCDEGDGGDVWFLSRTLQPLDAWFKPSTQWGMPVVISGDLARKEISSICSATDAAGNIHAVWVQNVPDQNRMAIVYARWDGNDWIEPDEFITALPGTPTEMSVYADTDERLLLVWVDRESGNLYFDAATLGRTNVVPQWEEPVSIPSISNLNNGPDITADSSGRILIIYSVSINEKRGVYAVQSTDGGKNWSSPVQVFDAASAGWEKVGHPRIALSSEGILHTTFVRGTLRSGQAVGLYYARSLDGGASWSEAELIGEGEITWSDLVSYDSQIVHALWQENDGLVFVNSSRLSQDDGVTWSRVINVSGVSDTPLPVALAFDGNRQLHFVKLIRQPDPVVTNQEEAILEDWNWTGSNWELASRSPVAIKGTGDHYALTANITPDGFLGVSILAQYHDHMDETASEIQTYNRFLGQPSGVQEPAIVVLPTVSMPAQPTEVTNILPTQPVNPAILYDDNIRTTTTQKNMVGLAIAATAVIVTALLLARGRPKPGRK